MGLFDKIFGGSKSTAYPIPVSDVDFAEKVLESDLPVVVEFTSATCPSCHVMTGLLKELAPEYDGRLRVFNLNVNYCPEARQKYKIMAVPTLITFADGRPGKNIHGLIPIGEIRRLFDEIVDK